MSAFRVPGGDSHLGPAQREGGQPSAAEVAPAQAEEAAGRVDSRAGRGSRALHLDSPHGSQVSQGPR